MTCLVIILIIKIYFWIKFINISGDDTLIWHFKIVHKDIFFKKNLNLIYRGYNDELIIYLYIPRQNYNCRDISMYSSFIYSFASSMLCPDNDIYSFAIYM